MSSAKGRQFRPGLNEVPVNMLNCFKDYEIIKSVNHIFDFGWHKKTEFTVEQPFILPFRCCQYYFWWCLSDLSHQDISRHGIDPISQNIPFLASEG